MKIYKIISTWILIILVIGVVGCQAAATPNPPGYTSPLDKTTTHAATTPTNMPDNNFQIDDERNNADYHWILGAKAIFGYTWVDPYGHSINSDKARDWAYCDQCEAAGLPSLYELDPNDWTDNRLGEGDTGRTSFIIHNGNDEATSFSVKAVTPDHVEDGWLKAPIDMVVNWVDISNPIPLLDPLAEIEIKVVLRLPGMNDKQAKFWQITSTGHDYLYDTVNVKLKEITKEIEAEYPDDSEEVITYKAEVALIDYIEGEADLHTLSYVNGLQSVSYGRFKIDRAGYDEAAQELKQKGFLAEGDLREDNWEFWIEVKDTSQTSFVSTIMGVRWLVVAKV